MKQKKRLGAVGILLLILAAFLLVGELWSRDFASFSNWERAEEFYIYSTDAGEEHKLWEARPEKEALQPLMEVLGAGTVRLDGRSRYIQWQKEDTLYHISFYHAGEGVWVEDANFALCTDGMLYVSLDRLGYIRYRLTDCDMTAVDAELKNLLSMDRAAGE